MKFTPRVGWKTWLTVCLYAGGVQSGCKIMSPKLQSDLDEAWNKKNNPISNLALSRVKYESISKSKTLQPVPWSGSYWPVYQMGTANRWQAFTDPKVHPNKWFESSKQDDFDYQRLSKSEAENISDDKIAALSPTEKYDLFQSRYEFPLTYNIMRRAKMREMDYSYNNRTLPKWEGICSGWSMAATHVAQPGAYLKITSRDGRHCIKFLQTDLMALVSQAFEDGEREEIRIGETCPIAADKINRDEQTGRILENSCEDTNAGAFHIAVTQLIDRGTPLIADLQYSDAIWNQPIFGYQITPRGAIRRFSKDGPLAKFYQSNHKTLPAFLADVTMEIKWVTEASPSLDAVLPIVKTTAYQYTLELDGDHYIIGGEWGASQSNLISSTQSNSVKPQDQKLFERPHPDFLWLIKKVPTLEGVLDMGDVLELISKSRTSPTNCELSISPLHH